MTAPRGSSPEPPPDDDSRSTALGAVLIVVAVVIGLILLGKGLSQENGVVDTSSSKGTTSTTAADAGTTTTTATPTTHPPADVGIVVANGSGGSGLAAANADKLAAAGYTKTTTADAPLQATSNVYFGEGYQDDAGAVAQALGLDPSTVAAMPASPPVSVGGNSILVIIGSDQL